MTIRQVIESTYPIAFRLKFHLAFMKQLSFLKHLRLQEIRVIDPGTRLMRDEDGADGPP